MKPKDSTVPRLRSDKKSSGESKMIEGDSAVTFRQPYDNPDVDILFQLLATYKDGNSTVKLQKMIQMIKSAGIIFSRDPRLREFQKAAEKITGDECLRDYTLSYDEFCSLMEVGSTFLTNVLMKRQIIEDFESFSDQVKDLYTSQIHNNSGVLSNELPEFQKADENIWGLAICTIDGQRVFAGDSTVTFTMQNLCKPFLHALALSTLEKGKVDEYIAYEPVEICREVLEVNSEKKPSNPMVNSGALMLSCLISAISFKGRSEAHLQEAYNTFIQNLLDNDYMDFQASSYQAKKDGADLLRCLIHCLASECKLPPHCNIQTALDLYIKACSIEINVEGLSVLAATLANGGITPFTEKKFLEKDQIKEILSSVYTFGLYDFSGESGFAVGMPMKCSTSGGLMMVIPGQMGIGLYSPLLNEHNISARSYSFCVEFIKFFKLHPYDLSNGREEKKFILRRKMTKECVPYCGLFNSAAKGDIREVTNLDEQKVDFFQTDPFGHNVLHVAAAGGSTEVVKYLLEHYPSLANQKDKWNRIPRDYINEIKQYETARLFERIGKNT